MTNEKKMLLGKILVDKKLITGEQLDIALKKQKEIGELLGMILLELGFIDEESKLIEVIAQQQGVRHVDLEKIDIPAEVLELIPVKIARRYHVIPIEIRNNVLMVAMSKPYDILLRDELKILTECDVRPVLASYRDINEAIRKYYAVGSDTIEEIIQHEGIDELVQERAEEIDQGASEATIGKFINQILAEAYDLRATDIHIEPFEKKICVRYRIDGMLHDTNVPENIDYFKDNLISRIKILSNLNISERRLPQDGRFRIQLENVELDLRVSFMPSQYGESIVIRILNSARLYSFNELQLSNSEQQIMEGLIKRPHGIIFMTGPTGSGKTTTLYTCLSNINSKEKKIITIEDPIEYRLSNVIQIQIKPEIDLTFARGLRSVLRHDPDVIMVGEVRDVETAEIAIQMALTGHLVFSTLHTNDAVSGVTRLLNMGIEPYLITDTIDCFIAQRLVCTICPRCKYEKKLSQKIADHFDVTVDKDMVVYAGKGCSYCNSTGYYGRLSIFEFFIPNDDIKDMILDRHRPSLIKKKAIEAGMQTLRMSGWDRVKKGLTTPEEVLRVTHERSRRK